MYTAPRPHGRHNVEVQAVRCVGVRGTHAGSDSVRCFMQPSAEPAPERSRSFSWADPAELVAAARESTGLDFVERLSRGELPPPPIVSMLGMEIVEVAPSRVVFALEPAEWMFNPIGSVHGGIAATLLDSAMGCAI